MRRYVIGHDVGTGGCKGVLATTTGELVARSFQPYAVYHPRANWAEQDPYDWWHAVAEGTRGLLEESGVDPAQAPSRVTKGLARHPVPPAAGLSGRPAGADRLPDPRQLYRPDAGEDLRVGLAGWGGGTRGRMT